MTGPRKYLLFLLIICTLGYSSAWAFDEHVLEQLEAELASKSAVFDDSSDGEHDADTACDHCCHISSHLVAIFSATTSDLTNSASIYLLSLNENHISYIVNPDLKPPRV